LASLRLSLIFQFFCPIKEKQVDFPILGMFVAFYYLVSERKLGIFSKIKEGENYNHRNTSRISRIII
jgi:hypothetical protein